jgi:hypothetical protein
MGCHIASFWVVPLGNMKKKRSRQVCKIAFCKKRGGASLDYSQKTEREASLSGRGQRACALMGLVLGKNERTK